MHVLVVVSHPNTSSMTHSVARWIAEEVGTSGRTVEIADLTAEGFDPRFGAADVAVLAVLADGAVPPADALAEQARIDRADALVLVYPIYW